MKTPKTVQFIDLDNIRDRRRENQDSLFTKVTKNLENILRTYLLVRLKRFSYMFMWASTIVSQLCSFLT